MRFLLSVLLLVPVAALAQSAPTPKEQAMGSRIMFEINASVECNASLIENREDLTRVRAALDAANKKIKELEAPKE